MTDWKQTVRHEMQEYFFNFAFLAFFFVSFAWYRRLIQAGSHHEILGWWAPLIESAVLAKIIMIGDLLHLGRRFGNHSLLTATCYRTLVFGLFTGCCKVLEHLAAGHLHGKTVAASWHHILNQGWPEILASSLMIVVAFLPFFAYKELEDALGPSKLRALLVNPRTPNQALPRRGAERVDEHGVEGV